MKLDRTKKFFSYLWRAFDVFYAFYFALTFFVIAFIFAAGFSKIFSSDFLSRSDILVFSTALIAINIALAALMFTYASNFEKGKKEALIKIGEKFVLSSIAFILYLSLMGLTKVGCMDELLNGFPGKKYIVWPLAIAILILLLAAFIFFIYATWMLIRFIIKENKYMNIDELKIKVNKALDELYEKDYFLIEKGLCERCLNHRFAIYLEKQNFGDGYFVDCEYNKSHLEEITSPKKVSNINGNYIDIIITKRDGNYLNDLVCFEVKRSVNNNAEEIEKDKKEFENINWWRRSGKRNWIWL